jgi:tripartite-type tricarboxylate transporter receptor subunit TctC
MRGVTLGTLGRRLALNVGLTLGFVLASTLALAQPYPSKPITVVVPFAPGGISDITMRPLAPAMSRVLGQNLVIENRPGAGGGVGMAYFARQKPDGYTIMMALSSISTIPVAEQVSGRQPSYQLTQFAPIALVSADPTVLLVPADSPYKTVADLIDDAKKRPGQISYSTSGLYGTTHVAMEMVLQATGARMNAIPYQSGGQAMNALLANQVNVTIQSPGVAIPHIRGGKVRAIAGWGAERIAALPEVPTLKESGIDAEFYIWSGLFAPAGTPPEVMARLRAAAKEAVQDEGFRRAMGGMATPIQYLDAPEFAQFWDRDAKRLDAVVRKMGKLE